MQCRQVRASHQGILNGILFHIPIAYIVYSIRLNIISTMFGLEIQYKTIHL